MLLEISQNTLIFYSVFIYFHQKVIIWLNVFAKCVKKHGFVEALFQKAGKSQVTSHPVPLDPATRREPARTSYGS